MIGVFFICVFYDISLDFHFSFSFLFFSWSHFKAHEFQEGHILYMIFKALHICEDYFVFSDKLSCLGLYLCLLTTTFCVILLNQGTISLVTQMLTETFSLAFIKAAKAKNFCRFSLQSPTIFYLLESAESLQLVWQGA